VNLDWGSHKKAQEAQKEGAEFRNLEAESARFK